MPKKFKLFFNSNYFPLVVLVFIGALGWGASFALDSFVQLLLVYLVINMILASSLNLINGITGQFSLGHAGFMAIGAYSSAFLSLWLNRHFGLGENAPSLIFIVLALAAGASAGLAGYLVGLPSLRLKGDYLAVVTLGFSEIIRVVIINTNEIGGPRGFGGFLAPQSFLFSFTHALFWLVFCYFLIQRLLKSNLGRSFLSVREDEIAAESLGVDTTKTKVRAFVISSFFAGVAGSLFAHFVAYLTPQTFSFAKTVDIIIMVVLGGMGSLEGCLIAAVIVTLLPEALRPLQDLTGVDLRMLIYSLMLILVMILRPQGIYGILQSFKKRPGAK